MTKTAIKSQKDPLKLPAVFGITAIGGNDRIYGDLFPLKPSSLPITFLSISGCGDSSRHQQKDFDLISMYSRRCVMLLPTRNFGLLFVDF
jgi:hypothetical protein